MLPRQVTVHHPFTHLAQAKVCHLQDEQTVAVREEKMRGMLSDLLVQRLKGTVSNFYFLVKIVIFMWNFQTIYTFNFVLIFISSFSGRVAKNFQ